MKKIITLFCLVFVLLSISPENSYSIVKATFANEYNEVIKIEYVLIDGQWWKIIYYSDGGLETYAVQSVGD